MCGLQEWQTLFDTMVKQKVISKPVFGVWLEPFKDLDGSDDDSMAGELTLGGINEARYEPPLMMVPVSLPLFWQVKIGPGIKRLGGARRGLPPVAATETTLSTDACSRVPIYIYN